MGFSYKANTSDFRNTKVIDVYNELRSFGLDVDIFDDLVNIQEVKETYQVDILSSFDIDSYQVILKLINHLSFKDIQSDKIINFEDVLGEI